jgi:hypothetical protein
MGREACPLEMARGKTITRCQEVGFGLPQPVEVAIAHGAILGLRTPRVKHFCLHSESFYGMNRFCWENIAPKGVTR